MNRKLRKAGVFTLTALAAFIVGTSQVTCQQADARPSLSALDAMMVMVKDAVCKHYRLTGNMLPPFCPEPTACEQSIESGPCKAFLQRWAFDEATGECTQFIYGGCGANENNFPTRAACEGACVPCDGDCLPHEDCRLFEGEPYCVETCDRVRCEPGEVCVEQEVFCVTGPCPPIAQCIPETPEPSACEQPIEVGPCDALLPRYAFNQDSGVCEAFNYGGCGGNENRFDTLSECVTECGGDPCELPVESGPCRAYLPRYAYDAQSGSCELFIYGGCGGNPNNFSTLAECEQTCEDPVDPCTLDIVSGPCRAFLPSWGYDADAGKCVRFIYGGCGGNANRFPTFEACQGQCAAEVDRCDLPPEVGPCKAIIPRYYYDSSQDDCVEFNYGGCGGNENNFGSSRECLSACGR